MAILYYDAADLMAEMMIDFFLFLIIASIVVFVIQRIRKNRTSSTPTPQGTSKPSDAAQIVEDIKMTQTTTTTDAVNILDDLGEASPGYRHYCELIGTSMTSGGVLAPYSKREVAYYDLRCYRIESREGRDVETLIAHEKSIDPFYFTDASGDQKVYIDLESFGNNCILINSTNRVEGPNSDVSQALTSAMAKHGAGSSPRVSFAARALDAAATGANWLAGATEWTRRGLAEAFASVFGPSFAGSLGNAWRPQPAFAGAAGFGGTALGSAAVGDVAGFGSAAKSNANTTKGTAKFARYGMGRPGGFSGSMNVGGVNISFGGGRSSWPTDLDDFLEGALSGGRMAGYGGPYIRGGSSVTGTLLNIGLGMLLSGMNTTSSRPQTTVTTPAPKDSFRGYRIIEDVVPLGCPIYGLGEIYRTGTDVHLGKSVSESYPSSYFACKHEAEVIQHLS